MATTSISKFSVYNATGDSDTWGSENEYNRFYAGKYNSYWYRSKIQFNTNDIIISSSSKLVVSIVIAESNYYCSKLKARLVENTNLIPKNYYDSVGNKVSSEVIEATESISPVYETSGVQVGSGAYNKGTSLQFIFNTSVIKANTTYQIYVGQENISSGTYMTTATVSAIELTHESYTPCGAPTSVSAGGIITPNGTFTVSWSGASGGVSNSIKGYDIYYLISSTGAAPSTSTKTGQLYIESSAGAGSASIQLSGAQRGYKVVCGVVTKGNITGYDSNIKTGGLVTINSLPNVPNVSASAELITSNSSGVTITATAGASNNTDQTTNVYYSINGTTNRTLYSSPITANPSAGGSVTYYFWTHDGLEYSSSYVSKTITKNSKPTISINVSGISLTSVNNTSSLPYVVSPTINVNKGNDGQNSNKYTFKIYYGEQSSSLSKSITLATQTSLVYSITDIRTRIGVGKYYQIGVTRNDGLENSSEVFSQMFYVTSIPKIKNFYNTGKAELVIPKEYFSKQVCIYIDNDGGYDSITLLANNLEFGTETKLSTHSDQKFTNYDCSSLNSGVKYGFKVKFISSTGYSITTSNELATLTKINTKNPNIGLNLSWSGKVNPFTSNDAKLAFTDIFNEEWNKWGFSGNPSFTLQGFYNNNEVGVVKNLSATYDNSDTATLNLTGQSIYNLFALSNILDTTSIKDFSTKLILTTINAFGDIYEWPLNEKVVNFKTNLEIVEYSMQFTQKEESEFEIITPQCLKEGVIPYITIVCKSYQGPPIKLTVIGSSDENVFYTYEDNNAWSKQESSAKLGYKTPINYIFKAPLSAILEQSQDLTDNANFKTIISLANTVQSNLNFDTELKIGKHVKSTLSITEALYIPPENSDGDGSIDLKININDWGASDIIETKQYKIEIQYKLPSEKDWKKCGYLQETEEGGKVNLTDEVYNSSFGYNYNLSPFTNTMFNKYDEEGIKIGEYDYIVIKLVITTKASVNAEKQAETSKTFNSIEHIIYNIKPTVSYRKNKIGINHNTPENLTNAVLVIGEHAGSNTIYLCHSGEESINRTINLVTGEIRNFIIDGGGDWGDTVTLTLPAAESYSF